MRRALSLLLVTVLAAGVHAAAPGVAKLEAFTEELRSLRATFRQSLYDESGAPIESSSGIVWLQRPGRFRWEYETPYEQIIVGDGERVWLYDRELEQVTVRPVDDTIGITPAALLASDRPVRESFLVADGGEEGGLDWVELRPRADEATFTLVRLGFGARHLESMQLEDGFGQTTVLDFADVSRNPALDPALFRFSPPPGVDVIGAGPGAAQ